MKKLFILENQDFAGKIIYRVLMLEKNDMEAIVRLFKNAEKISGTDSLRSVSFATKPVKFVLTENFQDLLSYDELSHLFNKGFVWSDAEIPENIVMTNEINDLIVYADSDELPKLVMKTNATKNFGFEYDFVIPKNEIVRFISMSKKWLYVLEADSDEDAINYVAILDGDHINMIKKWLEKTKDQHTKEKTAIQVLVEIKPFGVTRIQNAEDYLSKTESEDLFKYGFVYSDNTIPDSRINKSPKCYCRILCQGGIVVTIGLERAEEDIDGEEIGYLLFPATEVTIYPEMIE